MILFAALVPPLSAMHAVGDLVRGVDAEPVELRRPEDANLVIARFGNTTTNDAERLIGALRTASSDWKSPPSLTLGGGRVTETATERTLEVEVRGDIEALIAFGLDVKETAQQLRFLLDRRNMHPFLTLSTARLGEGAGFDAVATALNDFESEPWQATHLSMRKQTYGAAGDSEEVASIELPQG